MTDAELERYLVLDAGAGPAQPIDAADADALIEAVLDGAGFGPGSGGGTSGGNGARGGGRVSGSGGGAAAGTKLALIAGIALVIVAIVLVIGRDRRRGEHAAEPPADAAIDSALGSAVAAVPPPAPAAITHDEPPAIDMTDVPAPKPRAKPAPQESAADLLGEANAKRAAKQWRESDALYARVVARAPKSLAAQTALIASASLRLEHLGDAKGALQRFRRALAIAPSGALAEDARWGIAEVARATHDRAAEAAALDDFLAHHASSPLAERAKARRAELP